MSKASLRASIDSKKADIARLRTEIATWRSRKSSSKDKTFREYCESSIRRTLASIGTKQRDIASLRERMKYEK